MHQSTNITGNIYSTFHNAGILNFWRLENVDNQHYYAYKNTFTFTGKEKDSETGVYYFDGVYDVDAYSSDKYPDNFILNNKNVSKDRKILIHSGNTGEDTKGCLLPGNTKGYNRVNGSKNNLSKLRSFIKTLNNKPIKLIITSSL